MYTSFSLFLHLQSVLKPIKLIYTRKMTNKNTQQESWGWYDLTSELVEIIIPKLKAYKEGYIKEGMSIPNWLLEEKQDSYSQEEIEELRALWIEKLDIMITSFELINNPDKYDEKTIQKGLDLFGKHFLHLWD